VSTSRPSRRIETRSEIRITSSSLWLTKTTDEPCLATSRMTANTFSTDGKEKRGRLVEDQRFAALVVQVLDRAREPDKRPFRRRNVLHDSVRLDVQSQCFKAPLRPAPLLAPVELAEARRLIAADPQVLEHGQRPHDADVLMQESQAQPAGLAGFDRQPDRLAPHVDFSGIGRMIARDYLDEGRLSRSVLADQGVDLAASKGEVHR